MALAKPLRQLLRAKIPRRILHIGADYGQEVASYVDAGVAGAVFVEARQDAFERLSANVGPHGYEALLALAWNEDGVVKDFLVSSNDGASSSVFLFGEGMQEFPEIKVIRRLRLVTSRLDTLFREQKRSVDCFDTLVADVQGAEQAAIEGLGEYLGSIRQAVVEVSLCALYDQAPQVDQITAFMRERGFVLRDLEELKGYGNALFCRER